MLRSLYTAATGMMTQRTRMDAVTNNLTNVDTVGYKKDHILSRSFADMLLERVNDPNILNRQARAVIGDHNLGIYVDELSTNFNPGPLEQTGELSELAISGDGFFAVNTPQGIRYTRAGNFTVDAQGMLVTNNGNYVLDVNNNPINVGFNDFTVNSMGNVLVDGVNVTTIAVRTFQDQAGLRKAGENLYYHYNNEVPAQSQNYTVQQGFLEGSNVEIASEVVEMITTSRAYDANQKMVQMIDSTLQKTVNDIGTF